MPLAGPPASHRKTPSQRPRGARPIWGICPNRLGEIPQASPPDRQAMQGSAQGVFTGSAVENQCVMGAKSGTHQTWHGVCAEGAHTSHIPRVFQVPTTAAIATESHAVRCPMHGERVRPDQRNQNGVGPERARHALQPVIAPRTTDAPATAAVHPPSTGTVPGESRACRTHPIRRNE
jgi:hypothetical protein